MGGRGEAVAVSRRKAFEALRTLCRAKPGAVEEYPWGVVVWKVGGKLFAIAEMGGNAFTVKSTPADQAVLTQHPAVEVASHVGRFGWVTVTATDASTLDLARLLIDLSYDMVARRGRGPRPHASSRSKKRTRDSIPP
jgi:predicted DNA-binding protein (MmcQ/YjbR family)